MALRTFLKTTPGRCFVQRSNTLSTQTAATTRKPKRRYVKGYGARPALFVRKWFGDGAYEFVVKRMAS